MRRLTDSRIDTIVRLAPKIKGGPQKEVIQMDRIGMLGIGVILVILGIVLRWNLIDFLVDLTGLILLVVGVVLIVLGLIKMFSGKSQTDY